MVRELASLRNAALTVAGAIGGITCSGDHLLFI